MSYTRIQFIGHAIHTGPDAGQSPPRYPGLADPQADIAARVRFVLDTLDTTRQHAAVDRAATTLKVFMLPEFFFRGALGGYRMDHLQALFAALQAGTSDDCHRHWVFVFGTGIGYSHAGDVDPAQDLDEHATIVNAALFQPGGCGAAAADAAHLAVKEFMSGIDFIDYLRDPRGFALRRVAHDDRMETPLDRIRQLLFGRSERQRWCYDGNAAFAALGIDWGVEICLDHLLGRLNKAGDRATVQLVPSCGASIDQRGIARGAHWVFNVDGLNDDGFRSRGGSHTQLLDVRRERSLTPVVADLSAHAAQAHALFVRGAGDAHIYPAVAL